MPDLLFKNCFSSNKSIVFANYLQKVLMSTLGDIKQPSAQNNVANTFYMNTLSLDILVADTLTIDDLKVTDITFSQAIPDDVSGHGNTLITNNFGCAPFSTNSTLIGSMATSTISTDLSSTVMLGNNDTFAGGSNQRCTMLGSNQLINDGITDAILIGESVNDAGSGVCVIGSASISSIISNGDGGIDGGCDLGNEDISFGNIFVERVNTIQTNFTVDSGELYIYGGSESSTGNVGFEFNADYTGGQDALVVLSTQNQSNQSTSPTTPVTQDGTSGQITTQSMTIAGLGSNTFNFSNSSLNGGLATMNVNILNYTGSAGIPTIRCNNYLGQTIDIIISNAHPTNAIVGQFLICYQIS